MNSELMSEVNEALVEVQSCWVKGQLLSDTLDAATADIRAGLAKFSDRTDGLCSTLADLVAPQLPDVSAWDRYRAITEWVSDVAFDYSLEPGF